MYKHPYTERCSHLGTICSLKMEGEDACGMESSTCQSMFLRLDVNLHRLILYMCDSKSLENFMKTCKYIESLIMMDVCLLKMVYGLEKYVDLAIYRTLHRNNMDWFKYICQNVIYEGYHSYKNEIESARIGNLEILKYLHKLNRNQWDAHISSIPSLNGGETVSPHEFHINDFYVCRAAVSNGHLHCLKYLASAGYKLDMAIFVIAEQYGRKTADYGCLNYLISMGCPEPKSTEVEKPLDMTPEVGLNAIMENNVRKLQVSLFGEYKTDIRFCNLSALLGYIDCLKLLHKLDYRWDSTTCEACAEGGHLNCLEFVHQGGCQLTEKVISIALKLGHLDILIYALSNNCPYNNLIRMEAKQSPNKECLEYVNMMLGGT